MFFVKILKVSIFFAIENLLILPFKKVLFGTTAKCTRQCKFKMFRPFGNLVDLLDLQLEKIFCYVQVLTTENCLQTDKSILRTKNQVN